MTRPLVRILCLPDVDRVIGGVKQLYRHVEHLIALGWDAAVLTEVDGFRPSWFSSSAPSLSVRSSALLGELQPHRTILVLPETYVNLDLNSVLGFNLSDLSRIIFNQNAYYTYSGLSTSSHTLLDFYFHNSLLHVLSISEDTHDFLVSNLSIPDSKISRIVNAVEPIFVPSYTKSNTFHWMPRKNPDHVNAVLEGIRLFNLSHSQGWVGSPLENLSHDEVAKSLNSSRIFLSFGHPEGFGLPVAEAMASGCWVVGYGGGGANELFRFGGSELVPFGDWKCFLEAFQRALTNFQIHPSETAFRLSRQTSAINALYGCIQERESVDRAWTRIHKSFDEWISSR